jgi:hypothetical protein
MINLSNPPTGLVGAGNGKTGISAFLQHHLVGTGTHAFIIGYPEGSKKDIPVVFESDMRVGFDTWENYLNDKEYDIWLYSINGVKKEEIEYALDYCYRKLMGVTYGFFEWLWFPYRMFCEKILHTDVRKQKNWFKKWAVDSCICTELFWWFLWAITGGVVVNTKWSKLRAILDQWSPDTLTANDTLHILENNPDIFKLEMKRVNGVITIQ